MLARKNINMYYYVCVCVYVYEREIEDIIIYTCRCVRKEERGRKLFL